MQQRDRLQEIRNNKPSIDKLDPDGGYTDDNTWVICTTCNTMKQNATTPDRLRSIERCMDGTTCSQV